ncbi:MAG: GldG family protein [Treponema sp.]|jgi:hypothetical protein|nr:GldG family protein [Treponema sp.]
MKFDLSKSLHTKHIKYGGYAVLITIAVIAGLILINLLLGQFSPRFDLTENQLFSLSEQTRQVLDGLTSPISIFGLWAPGQEVTQVAEVIKFYTDANRNIHFEAIDPDRNPGLLTKYDKDKTGLSSGTLIVEGEKGFRVIPYIDMLDIDYSNPQSPRVTGFAVEKRITSAIVYAGTGVTPIIYEISGHQETSLSQLNMKETIEKENYTLLPLNLLRQDVPQDASALIINSPKSDLAPGEAEKILAYLEKGGRLLILSDMQSGQETPNLDDMLRSYGIRFDYGLAVETDQNYTAGTQYFIIPNLASHDITKSLIDKETPMILTFAQGLTALETRRRTVEVTPFLNTSGQGYLRTDTGNNSSYRLPSDISGPIVMGMAVKDPQYAMGQEPQTRIAAIACGSLLEQVGIFSQIPGNIELFMNSLFWLEERPDTVSVSSKSLFIFPMQINNMHIIVFGAIFVILIPLACFIAGFVTWLRRRHL